MFSFLKEYFRLSNTEQKGVIVLLLLILVVFISPKIYSLFQEPTKIDDTKFEEWMASFEVGEEEVFAENDNQYDNDNSSTNSYSSNNSTTDFVTYELKPFNPNTASHEELVSLGIPKNVSYTIVNFRESGAKFYKKEDLKKVYGITDDLYSKLSPYISIPAQSYSNYNDYSSKSEDDFTETDDDFVEEKIDEAPVMVNINIADSTTLTKLSGIGKTYAARIVKFRDLLGGFHATNQLLEVYGIEEELYNSLLENISVSGAVKKLNLNTNDIDGLKAHPYIDYNLAKAIVNYRNTHGDYASVDDLQQLYAIDEATFQKIKPYLSAP